MHRIDHASATEDNKFTAGNPAEAIPATTVTADIMNSFQEEICAVIEEAGGELDKEDNAQILAAIQTLIASLAIPAGVILDYAGGTIPDGFLACDGAAVSRTTYAALFAKIGTTHGAGDGSSTFNLPDSRGRATIGDGTGSGLTVRTLGQHVGAETHTLTAAQLPDVNFKRAADGAGGGANFAFIADTKGTVTTESASSFGFNTGVTNGQSHNNMQPSLVVKKIIKF